MDNHSMSVLGLILNASWVVQLVMLTLLAASVISWWFIFSKRKQLQQAHSNAEKFEEKFWSGGQLAEMYESLQRRRLPRTGIERIFEVGFKEYARQQSLSLGAEQKVEAAQRVMRVALSKELDALENRLSFLATVGSTSPYVGLFGTVIGIMNAFIGLGNAKQATLNMVAPGIAEALIATAIGLLAAIPAVVAYNRFSNQVERVETRYENFKEEFVALMHRQAATQGAQAQHG